MSIALIIIIGCVSVYIAYRLYRSFFNPIALYVIPWCFISFFYELKLIRFIEISTHTWFVIIWGYLSFLFGLLISKLIFKEDYTSEKFNYKFSEKEKRVIYYIIMVSSILGIIISLLNWRYLINKFGSITNVFLQANVIYQMRVEGEIPEAVPYLYIISYVGIFFGGIYTAITKRISFVVVLPFIAVILKEIANFGRAGILLAVFCFIFTFLYANKYINGGKYFKIKENKKIFVVFLIILVLSVLGASLVKSTRGAFEHFKGTNTKLANLSKNFFISPSVYFYFSSHIGVLSKYLESPTPNTSFGSNTFLPIYNLLSKFELVEKKSFYQKGYFIPQWSNTGTYLREIHEDFGDAGIFIVPFLIGFLVSYLLYRLNNNFNLYNLLFVVYGIVLVAFTWLTMITRLSHWLFGLIFNLITVYIYYKTSRITNNAQ